ncbi:hypothetical protein E8E12_003436 [Didymella heteroderae]|uniref:Uncharacterized protein n=1 Tax=Didymella heteroderae TaxID=1769908 RepID=A0A9P4WIA9_9PLEO|nr:hypothetical protein E8E12_003436 [Didymella heteroderae]
MEPPDAYHQWLQSLASLPEPEAAEALRKAFLKGTGHEGISLMRADVPQYFEHVHHYYGCPENEPCDHYDLDKPLPWEEKLLISMEHIEDSAEEYMGTALRNYFDWSMIRQFTYRYGPLIRDRWLKMSTLQRKAILLEAHPNMPLKHRPDIDRQYAFPHLNLEDLMKSEPFLILLDARVSHLPFKFACSDYQLAPLLKLRPALLEKTKYTMGIVNEEYGMLQEWGSEEEAAHAMRDGDSVHPLHGVHMLTLQSRIYEFIRICLGQILTDKDMEIATTDHEREGSQGTRLDALPPPTSCNVKQTSLTTIVRESQYRVPTLSDLSRLKALASGCRDTTEDHIWMLREDPAYFAETILEHKEHRPELLLGVRCGRSHKNSDHDSLWARTLRDSAANPYVDLYVWDEIQRHLEVITQLAEDHAGDLGYGLGKLKLKLPNRFQEALVQAWAFFEFVELDLIQQLKTGWPSSLEVRAHFGQDCAHCQEDVVVSTKFKGMQLRKRDKELEHIFTLFQYLWEPPVRQTLKVHTLVDAIQHLLDSNPRAQSLTSPWVASLLSKLSIVSECLRQLNFFQPWAKHIANQVKDRQTELLLAHSNKFACWRSTLQTDFRRTNLINLGKPTSQFRYPVKKRRSQMNVETLQAAEKALDAFWHAADAHFLECTGTTPHEIMKDSLKERTLQRTLPWVESELASEAATTSSTTEYLYIPISTTQHDASQQITGVFNKLAVWTTKKVKTHGLAVQRVDSLGVYPSDEEEVKQPAFVLDRRAHKVFRTLFHSPLSRDHPGDTPWQDFLYAMMAVGFSVEKLQGSAWQFTPTNLDVQRPIQFHEPHPTHKLPFTWARRFGRRLARTYGWRSSMFQLAE